MKKLWIFTFFCQLCFLIFVFHTFSSFEINVKQDVFWDWHWFHVPKDFLSKDFLAFVEVLQEFFLNSWVAVFHLLACKRCVRCNLSVWQWCVFTSMWIACKRCVRSNWKHLAVCLVCSLHVRCSWVMDTVCNVALFCCISCLMRSWPTDLCSAKHTAAWYKRE